MADSYKSPLHTTWQSVPHAHVRENITTMTSELLVSVIRYQKPRKPVASSSAFLNQCFLDVTLKSWEGLGTRLELQSKHWPWIMRYKFLLATSTSSNGMCMLNMYHELHLTTKFNTLPNSPSVLHLSAFILHALLSPLQQPWFHPLHTVSHFGCPLHTHTDLWIYIWCLILWVRCLQSTVFLYVCI